MLGCTMSHVGRRRVSKTRCRRRVSTGRAQGHGINLRVCQTFLTSFATATRHCTCPACMLLECDFVSDAQSM